MKKTSIVIATVAAALLAVSCENSLNVQNPNNQTTYDFGNTESDLNEAVIACYNRIRLEGSFARVGYTMDAVRGDEVWNASQVWYLPYDNLNSVNTDEIGNQWIWRDCYHIVNRCNYVLQQVEKVKLSTDSYNQIKGQALFLRGLAYYTISTYQQVAVLFTNYSQYASMSTMYAAASSQDEVFNQIEEDFSGAMAMLPSRDKGGEWATGRATCGAAAGYYARALMFRHKYADALKVLKDIIAGKYGTYKLMADYGDNCREGTAYENNAESLFEVQFLDYGMGGTDEEWTPVNISKNATQGHAVESNYASYLFGSWADLAASPWLYQLFKSETTVNGELDPRLYWTLCTYEKEYDQYTNAKTDAYPNGGDPRSNVVYGYNLTSEAPTADYVLGTHPLTNGTNGGISIAKNTNARNNIYQTIVTGLHCGVNLRLMRYSDVLLRAAECINEEEGPTEEAIGYINQVRNRAALPSLELDDFRGNADKLFEQIANVERPKEFGCENGRGIDLIRWGFFYDSGRLAQLIKHGSFNLSADPETATQEVSFADGTADYSSFQYFSKGHEYFPIAQGTLDDNPNFGLGNSANTNTDNGDYFRAQGWTVHPAPIGE